MQKGNKRRIKRVLSTFVFLTIGLCILGFFTRTMSIQNEYAEHAEMMINGFYDLEKDSVDVVLVGNSHLYRYWQPAFAWEMYGMTSTNFSFSDMPAGTVKNCAIETLKTQSPKVLVIDITPFANVKDEVNNKIYLLLKSMRFSPNYVAAVYNYIKYHGIHGSKMLQYIFPIVQFHSRWSDMKKRDYMQTLPSYLNSNYQKGWMKTSAGKNNWVDTKARRTITPRCEAALRDLLEWSSRQETEILFYAAPQIRGKKHQASLNYIGDIIAEYGFEMLNCNKTELFEQFAFDIAEDFQGQKHTSLNGSYKFTKVFGQMLKERYQLEAHSQEEQFKNWTELTAEYHEIVDEYLRIS